MTQSDFRADLHCHTVFSDGSDTPQKVIDMALEKGLSGLSITDHDTLAAYAEALPYANEKGLLLLPGIEFSASFKGDPVHILGYAFSLKSEAILHLCERHKKRRRERNLKILERLKGLGIVIDESELSRVTSAKKTLGRPHIAMILMHRGVVKSIKEAFDKYLGEGKRAFDPGEPVSVEETLEAIHEGKGKAIIAHPQLIKRRSTVREMLKQPFDGLEGYYARFSPAQEADWIARAKERDWIVTGGSDYHGTTKPQSILGSSWVNQETFDLLYGHYQNVASLT